MLSLQTVLVYLCCDLQCSSPSLLLSDIIYNIKLYLSIFIARCTSSRSPSPSPRDTWPRSYPSFLPAHQTRRSACHETSRESNRARPQAPRRYHPCARRRTPPPPCRSSTGSAPTPPPPQARATGPYPSHYETASSPAPRGTRACAGGDRRNG